MTKIKRNKSPMNTLADLAPTLYSLAPTLYSIAVMNYGVSICMNVWGEILAQETKQRCDEFALMNVAAVSKINKGKSDTLYYPLKGIKKYLNNFCKLNPKWKWEEEISFDIKTGRYLLTRFYRRYHKHFDEYERDYD